MTGGGGGIGSATVVGRVKSDGGVTTAIAADGTMTALAGGTAGMALDGSNATSAALQGIGTAASGVGATLTAITLSGPTLVGTTAGTPTYSGVPIYSGLSAGTQVSCLGLDSGNHMVLNAAACGSGSGGLTSVGLSVPGSSLFGVTGSPLVANGTLALTTTGTSGGIPYFSSGSALSPSAALTANLPVIGGGAGVAPSVGTRSGNTTAYVTTTGAQTSGDCVKIDASGNHVANGSACGTAGVSVTAGTPNIVVTPSPGTGTFTVGTTAALNTQSGASYTLLAGDAGKLVLRTNGSAQTDTVPQATGSFTTGFEFGLQTGAAGDTLTPTTSTVNGLASLKLGAQQASDWVSDGANWRTALGVPQPATQTGTTFLRDDMTWPTITGLGANPTASAGVAAVNGSASTFMRSDGAPAIPAMTATVAGLVPTPPNDAAKFLNGQGAFTSPSGTSGGGMLGYSDNGLTLTAGTRFVPVYGSGVPSTTEADYATKSPSATTVTNLQVNLSADPGSGQTLTVTLRKAGADTAVTCTITGPLTPPAAVCQDITHSVNIAQNDLIDWKVITTGTYVSTPSLTILANNGTSGVGVTSVSGTAPVSVATGTTTPVVSITGAAGQVLAGAGPAFTATPAVTSLALGGATIGSDNLAVTGTTTYNGAVVVNAASLSLSGNQSAAAWTTNGIRYKNVAATLTDTTSSGTVATAYTNVYGGSTIAASSATTYTNYFNTYIKDPIAGTNVTLTNKYGLGADTIYTPTLFLGATGTAGTVSLGNATSGTVTLGTVAGALGSVTASLPANTGTIAELNLAQSWTAKQTFTGSGPIEAGANGGNLGSVKLYGNTSGDVTVKPAAAAGTATVFQLPATNGANTNVLQTNGSGVTSWVAAGGGGVTCESGSFTASGATCGWTQTASSSATLDWTGLTKDNYTLSCAGVIPATDTQPLHIQFGTGGTPTYQTANYKWGHHYINESSAGGDSSSGSAAGVNMFNNAHNVTGVVTANATFSGLTQTMIKGMTFSAYGLNDVYYTTVGGGSWTGATTAITAIRLKFVSGNIASGVCTLYSLSS